MKTIETKMHGDRGNVYFSHNDVVSPKTVDITFQVPNDKVLDDPDAESFKYFRFNEFTIKDMREIHEVLGTLLNAVDPQYNEICTYTDGEI